LSNNTTFVSGTAAGTKFTLCTGSDNDQLNVSHLDQIRGPLDLVWTNGTKSLVVDDTSAAAADTYTVSSQELDRTGAAPIQFGPIALLELFASLTQQMLTRLDDIPATETARIFAGTGADIVVAAASSADLDNIAGSLFVQGGGNTTLSLYDQNAG